MRPTIEVTIVTYNSAKELPDCLSALREARDDNYRLSISVWDNASQDSTADLVAAEFPEVRLHRSDRNLGFGQAQNALIASSQADYVLLLNPDTVVTPDCLGPLVRELQEHPETTIAGPVIDSDDGIQPSAQRFPTLRYELAVLVAWRRLGKILRPLLDAEQVIHDVRSLPPLTAERREVEFLWATCWLMRRADAQRLGPFSPAFFLYDEDLEVCWRVATERGRAVQVRASRIFHQGGASSTPEAKRDFMLKGRRTYYRETGGRLAAATFVALQTCFSSLESVKRALGRS